MLFALSRMKEKAANVEQKELDNTKRDQRG